MEKSVVNRDDNVSVAHKTRWRINMRVQTETEYINTGRNRKIEIYFRRRNFMTEGNI